MTIKAQEPKDHQPPGTPRVTVSAEEIQADLDYPHHRRDHKVRRLVWHGDGLPMPPRDGGGIC